MAKRTRRTKVIALLCAVCTGVSLLLFLMPPAFHPYCRPAERVAKAELRAKDLLITGNSTLSPDPRLVFVGIDQTSYADVIAPEEAAGNPILAKLTNSFPWSRDVWAAVIEKLANAGAKVIVLDLVFESPKPEDEPLRAILDRHSDRVVIGANFVRFDKGEGAAEGVIYPSDSLISPKNAQGPWSDHRVGFVNFFTGADVAERDTDDVIRRAVFRVTGERGLPPKVTFESLAARAIEKLGAPELVPNDTQPHLFRFVAPPGSFRPLPLYTLFLPSHWENNYQNGKLFEGKLVLIGPVANILHDDHPTPFGVRMLGPEIHLNVISAALRGEFLRDDSKLVFSSVVIIFLGALAFLFAVIIRSPIRRLFAMAGCIAIYLGLCWVLVSRAHYLLVAFTPVIALSTSTLAGFTYDFILVRREKNRTRRTLERYVSKDVVRELLDNPQTYLNTLGGVRKPVTILFSDVRGFTTMTEGADPAQLVTQLNEYFKEMVGIVFTQHGSLDKFIGDAVMALWGSITSEGLERDAQHAVAAALAMRQSLARLNINWTQRGMKPLAFGIGINHGEVIVGNLGSEEKMEVSVIGDAVNLASRLEGLTKEYKLDLLLGESMVPLVREQFVLRTVGSVQPKGKTKAVRIFTVAADRQAGEQPPPWLARYEEGMEFYRARKFAEGVEAFKECLAAAPDDHLSQVYFEHCRDLMMNPPGLDWDTVVVMKTK